MNSGKHMNSDMSDQGREAGWNHRCKCLVHSLRQGVLWLGLTLLIGSGSLGLMGSELSPRDQAILRSGTSEGWYSPDKQTTQPLDALVEVNKVDVSDRDQSVYSPTPQPAPNPSKGGWWDIYWNQFWDGLRYIRSFLSLNNTYLNWIGLLILVAAVSVLIYYLMRNDFALFSRDGKRSSARRIRDQIRVTDLPFELEKTSLSLLEQSDAHRRKNDLSKAMIYYFSHLLVELDEAGLIRLTRGKTNRAYLRELRGYSRLGQYLGLNIDRFERVFFGRHELGGRDFDMIREQLPQFEGWIREANQQLQGKTK